MSEYLIPFALGGLFVYLATYHHVRFLERELRDAKGALYHRIGFKPEQKTFFDRLFKKEETKAPEKRSSEDIPDLLALQQAARESD